MFNHTTVLLEESVNSLNIKPSGIYVDATLGGAGHSQLILNQLNSEGKLYCFDQDEIAINNALNKFSNVNNVEIIRSNFVNMKEELQKRGVSKIDGVLFDLGVSSMQIDQGERGFSYINDGPLDMRMDTTSNISAFEIVNNYSQQELQLIFQKYGQEKFANLYSKVIVEKRAEQEISTTKQLTDLILDCIPKKAFYASKSHPAIRVFQALRIEVNKELDVFENTLQDLEEMMNIDGRIAVITFHSLEDRICKYYFKKWSELDSSLTKLPQVPTELQPKFKKITNKPILPSDVELKNNSRSRSAKLRVLERI